MDLVLKAPVAAEWCECGLASRAMNWVQIRPTRCKATRLKRVEIRPTLCKAIRLKRALARRRNPGENEGRVAGTTGVPSI